MTASTLHRFRMCSLEVHSEIALVELDAGDENVAASCVVQLGGVAPADIVRWLLDHEHRDGFLAKEDHEHRLIVHLEGAAIIVVSADNDTIVVHPEMDDADVISHLVVDHVLPRVLARRGYTVLHATCVAYGDRAVAFVGASGAGKSTLAMSAVQNGARLLADDCLVLDDRGTEFDVLASYAGSRLWSDSASALDGGSVRRTGQRHRQISGAARRGAAVRCAGPPRRGLRARTRRRPNSMSRRWARPKRSGGSARTPTSTTAANTASTASVRSSTRRRSTDCAIRPRMHRSPRCMQPSID